MYFQGIERMFTKPSVQLILQSLTGFSKQKVFPKKASGTTAPRSYVQLVTNEELTDVSCAPFT